MRYSLALFLFPLVGIPLALAQTTPQAQAGQCSLVLVNALPGPANLHVKFGAEDIWPLGFTPGQSTGGVLFPSGKKTVTLLCEGYAQTKKEIVMPSGGNFAMIFFPGEEIKEGSDKGKRQIGLFCPPAILAGQPPKEKNWHLLLAGPLAQAQLTVNAKTMDLKLGQPFTADGGKILVESRGQILLSASPEGEGNYWAVIYGDRAESLQAVYLNHVAYSVPKPVAQTAGEQPAETK